MNEWTLDSVLGLIIVLFCAYALGYVVGAQENHGTYPRAQRIMDGFVIFLIGAWTFIRVFAKGFWELIAGLVCIYTLLVIEWVWNPICLKVGEADQRIVASNWKRLDKHLSNIYEQDGLRDE